MMKPDYEQDNIKLYNADCMDIMKEYEDNYFDLAVVDPPYGINFAKKHTGKGWIERESKDWDKNAPKKEYFDELFRISKNQIIWGANYYPQYLFHSMGWIFWDKGQRNFSLADGELAFTSFQKALRVFTFTRGRMQSEEKNKWHPTQKPVKLYSWIYTNYAKEGQKILDSHLGSGSNAIAAHYAKMGEFVSVELDEDYFKAACDRIYKETRQQDLF